ncbi:DUF1320 domain-containing protein [Luteimonas sp. FXH3W]|uniref:DUF1320 domain-containing protein n=1 Tax=Aquilutibacter rugosus TaxID=3115820 RepID=A0ABU7UYH6_9GAMM
MSYVRPSHLTDGAETWREVSELYELTVDDLKVVIASDGVTDNQQAAEAYASLLRFCAQADAEVDSRLARRGYPLPLSATQFPVLTVWARAIARYHIHRNRDRSSEETGRIERDYRDALRALDMVAEGTLSLGANDPLLATAGEDPASVEVHSNARLFSRDTLGGL